MLEYSNGRRDLRTITALDAISGQPTGWHAGVDSAYALYGSTSDAVGSIVVRGSLIYVGGSFGGIGYRLRSGIAALDATTGVATDWNPGVSGVPLVLAVAGDTVVAGGSFSSIGGRAAGGLVAFDLDTGEATDWSPPVGLAEPIALAVAGTTIYVGCGYDTGRPGLPQPLGAIDLPSASILSWDPGGDGSVSALAADDSVVFVGGYFSDMGGGGHPFLAAVDRTTAVSRTPCPSANGSVYCLAWNGPTLIAAGGFTSLGGATRHGIGAFDAASGVLRDWDPAADNQVTTVAVSGSTVYAGGWFSTIGGKSRARIAALDATTGSATDWNPAADGAVEAMAVNGSTVYVGGLFTTIGGAARQGFAALDATTGLATSWDPALRYRDGIEALATSGNAIYAGGAIHSIGGRVVGQIARILPSPASPPTVRALGPGAGEVVRGGTVHELTWAAAAPSPGVESVDLYLSTTGSGGPWHLIGAGAANTGIYAWNVDPAMASTDCHLRVDARDYAGNLSSDIGSAAFTITDGALDAGDEPRPTKLEVGRAIPHPIRGWAQLEYSLPCSGTVRLSLIDLQGREVRVVHEGQRVAGRHLVRIDSRGLPSGLYFARLQAGGLVSSRRLIILE